MFGEMIVQETVYVYNVNDISLFSYYLIISFNDMNLRYEHALKFTIPNLKIIGCLLK